MVAPNSGPFNLLVGGITSSKNIAMVNKVINVKQIIPIKNRQVKQFAARNDSVDSVMVSNVGVLREVKSKVVKQMLSMSVMYCLSNKFSKSVEL